MGTSFPDGTGLNRPGRLRRDAAGSVTWRNTSLASGSPMLTRTPSPANGRTVMPASSASATRSGVRSASGSQTKLPCGSGTVQPCARSSATTRSRSATIASTRSISSSSAARLATAAAWATLETPKGSAQARTAAATSSCATSVADPEAGQPVGLGEGPHHRDVGVLGGQRQAVDRVVLADELAVGLVDHDEHVVGHPPTNARSSASVTDGPGRVVRRTDDDDLGAVGDRLGHGVEVVPAVGVDRHLHRDRAGRGDRDRVGLEGAPGVDDLVAGVAERLEQVVEHGDRSGAGGQPLRGTPSRSDEGGVQRGVAHVGVAVHLRDRGLGRLHDAGNGA